MPTAGRSVASHSSLTPGLLQAHQHTDFPRPSHANSSRCRLTSDSPRCPPGRSACSDPGAGKPRQRLTADGIELPETASYRWYGQKVSLPVWADPLGKTPEEVFGSAAAVRTLEKSRELAQSQLDPADHHPLTLPYFVTGQWGADYIGFSLFEGRVYRLEVRFKSPTELQFNSLAQAFKTAQLGPDSQLETRGYAAEIPEKWIAGRPAVFRLEPTWKYLFPQEFTFTPGMTVTQVLDGTQCNRKWPGRDDLGDYYILDQPNPTDRADDPATPHVQKFKVYVKDDKAVSMEKIPESQEK